MLSCGNKVSPASLITTSESSDYISAEPSLLSGMESQHSQVSLFSGSEAGSSLELFSQPPAQENAISASANSCTSTDSTSHVTNYSQLPMQTGSRKYYSKYLSLQSSAKETTSAAAGGLSVLSNNADTVASKMDFEAWKGRQQNQLERKQVLNDMTEIANEMTIKVNDNIGALREELKTSVDRYKTNAEESSSRWEKQTLAVLTQLLHGQEESRRMIREIQDELAQQRSMLTSLSSNLSSDTANSASVLADRVVEGVRSTIQQAAVSVVSVSTQTFSPHATSTSQYNNVKTIDQAVPIVQTVADCAEESLYDNVSKSLTAEDGLRKKSTFSTQHDTCASRAILTCNLPDKGEHPCIGHKMASNKETLLKIPVEEPDFKVEEGKATLCGKRRNEESPSVAPCRPGNKKARRRVKSTASTASRRSSRATKRPVKYSMDNCFSSSDDPTFGNEPPSLRNGSVLDKDGSRIKRKVSVKQADRSCSHKIKESPANALSDSLYSQTSTELLSGVQMTQPLPLVTTQTDQKEKFHRRNEAAKRRKMPEDCYPQELIIGLSDPDLLLREMQDCILNHVDTSDPSP